MARVVKWYNTKWFYLAVFLLLVIGIYFGARKTITYINYQEYLKTEVEALKKENLKLDSLYKATAAQKEKIRIIKEKIDISEDIRKLQLLLDDYEKIKKNGVSTNITEHPTPEELLNYLNKEIQ